MNFESKWVEWVLFPLLTFIGGLYKYFKSLKNVNQFTWFALFVQALGSLVMGLTLYFVGKAFSISEMLLCTLCVLSGMWGESMFKHFIRMYTRIPIPD